MLGLNPIIGNTLVVEIKLGIQWTEHKLKIFHNSRMKNNIMSKNKYNMKNKTGIHSTLTKYKQNKRYIIISS